jgi:hypothetical protein
MGYSRRREAREIAESIEESQRAIAGVTLGEICSRGMIMLDVACHSCPRRGRYRVTRLIDRYGSHLELSKLTTLLSADCSKKAGTSFFNRCGIYIPGWKPQLKA